MTSISSGSAGYYADVAAKSASGAKDKTASSSATPQQDTTVNLWFTGDILTLSAEALEAGNKVIDIEAWEKAKAEAEEKRNRPFEERSKHLSTAAWALGIDTTGKSYKEVQAMFFFNNTTVDTLRSQVQDGREKIDEQISNILKANNITLSKDETLNIKINQDGIITVGEGVSGDKRIALEKALNEDQTLGQDLLFASAQRRIANASTMRINDVSGSEAANYIFTDTVLKREYGLSLNDIKNGDNAILEQLIDDDEEGLYCSINYALYSLEKNGGTFEVSYAYKNGVTIEKGETDQKALNKMSSDFLLWGGMLAKKMWDGNLDYSVTLDSSGIILSAEVTAVRVQNPNATPDDMVRELNSTQRELTRYLSWSREGSNPHTTQSRLQQYVFDSQRLLQFNTGMDSATAKQMQVSFGSRKG